MPASPAGRAPSREPVRLARRPARALHCECTTGGPEQQTERQVRMVRGVRSPLEAPRGPKGRPALEPQGLPHPCSPSMGPRAPQALHASPTPYPVCTPDRGEWPVQRAGGQSSAPVCGAGGEHGASARGGRPEAVKLWPRLLDREDRSS